MPSLSGEGTKLIRDDTWIFAHKMNSYDQLERGTPLVLSTSESDVSLGSSADSTVIVKMKFHTQEMWVIVRHGIHTSSMVPGRMGQPLNRQLAICGNCQNPGHHQTSL